MGPEYRPAGLRPAQPSGRRTRSSIVLRTHRRVSESARRLGGVLGGLVLALAFDLEPHAGALALHAPAVGDLLHEEQAPTAVARVLGWIVRRVGTRPVVPHVPPGQHPLRPEAP